MFQPLVIFVSIFRSIFLVDFPQFLVNLVIYIITS